MKTTSDIIVVGAGIAGISAAAELAADATVIVLERESQPGYHATGRSAAYFAPAYGNAAVRGISAFAEPFYRSPPDGFSEVALLDNRDALIVASQGQLGQVESMLAENPRLVRKPVEYARQRVPVLSADHVAAVLHDESGGDLDVDAILQGYLRLLRRRGGQLRTGQEVTAVYRDKGLWQVSTGSGTFSAPTLVNAAGAWADVVAKMAGCGTLGMMPKRRTAILIDAPAGQDIAGWPLVIDVEEHFYFKPDAGQLLVSPADENPDVPCDARPDELDIAIAADRFETVTGLPVAQIRHSWAGLRTFAPDRTFVVGFDPRTTGFFWLAGQGGYGVQSAPGLAQLCAALINGAAPSAPFTQVLDFRDAVAPERFLQDNCSPKAGID